MGIRDDLKIPLSMLSISFLNESKYKGSYQGKRFMFEKKDIKENEKIIDEDGKEINKEKVVGNKLIVYLWKDLFNFENTDKSNMIIKEYEYSKEGIDKGIAFVEETNI